MTSRTFPRAAGTVNYWFSLTFSDFTDFSHTECHFDRLLGYVTRWRKFFLTSTFELPVFGTWPSGFLPKKFHNIKPRNWYYKHLAEILVYQILQFDQKIWSWYVIIIYYLLKILQLSVCDVPYYWTTLLTASFFSDTLKIVRSSS